MAGKGSSWRKGTNFKKYRDSEYWKRVEDKKGQIKLEIKKDKEEWKIARAYCS